MADTTITINALDGNDTVTYSHFLPGPSSSNNPDITIDLTFDHTESASQDAHPTILGGTGNDLLLFDRTNGTLPEGITLDSTSSGFRASLNQLRITYEAFEALEYYGRDSADGCLGGLTSGVIAKLLKDWQWEPAIPGIASVGFYEVLFVLSGVMRLAAAVLFLPHLLERNAGSTVEMMRFITANIYDNLFNAVLMPLRLLKVQPLRRSAQLKRRSEPAMRRAA